MSQPSIPPVTYRLERYAGLTMAGIAASLLTGYAREASVAAMYGNSGVADAFFAAFTLPEFAITAAPVVLGATLVPALIQRRNEAGDAAARSLAVSATLCIAGALAVLALLGVVLAPLYVPRVAPGFEEDGRELVTQLLRIMWPAAVFAGVGACAAAWLNARRCFGLAAVAPAVYNVAFVVVTMTLAPVAGSESLGWGVTLGAALAAVALALRWPHGSAVSLRSLLGDRRVWAVLSVAVPFALGYGLHYLGFVVDRMLASLLAVGSIADLNYARRIVLTVGQLSGMAVATAAFPALAGSASTGTAEAHRQALRSSMRLTWVICLPAMLTLSVLARPVVSLLFERGQFDAGAAAATSGLVPVYAVGLAADAIAQPLWRSLYSHRAGTAVAAINGLITLLRVLLDLVLVPWFGQYGIACSLSVALLVQFTVLVRVAGLRLSGIGIRADDMRFLMKTIVAVLALCACEFAAGGALLAGAEGIELAVGVMVVSAFGIGAYVALCAALGVREVTAAASALAGRARRVFEGQGAS